MLKNDITARNNLLLKAGLTVAASVWMATSAVADMESRFEMTVIQDAAYGADIVAGNLQSAIDSINAEEVRRADRFVVSNNLCVAYTMIAKFEKAETACDKAIEIAEENMRLNRTSYGFGGTTRSFAMALTNRGVLRAIAGDTGDARRDFTEARSLHSGSSVPKRNLQYLDVRQTQASID